MAILAQRKACAMPSSASWNSAVRAKNSRQYCSATQRLGCSDAECSFQSARAARTTAAERAQPRAESSSPSSAAARSGSGSRSAPAIVKSAAPRGASGTRIPTGPEPNE